MRTIALLMTVMLGFGCKPKDGGGTSKSETVTNSSGETVRKMTLRLVDHTLGGMIFPDGVTVTAQGLDDSESPVAFANGTTDAAVTYTRYTKWLYRAGSATNNYADMWHLVMLEFEIPASATKWKIDLSKLPDRECSPEPAVGTVADVPDVTDLADKTGSEFAIQGKCIYTHKFSGSVSGLKGDLKLASTDDQTLTVSAEG